MSEPKIIQTADESNSSKSSYHIIIKLLFEIEMNYMFNNDLSKEEKASIIEEIDKLAEVVRAYNI